MVGNFFLSLCAHSCSFAAFGGDGGARIRGRRGRGACRAARRAQQIVAVRCVAVAGRSSGRSVAACAAGHFARR